MQGKKVFSDGLDWLCYFASSAKGQFEFTFPSDFLNPCTKELNISNIVQTFTLEINISISSPTKSIRYARPWKG